MHDIFRDSRCTCDPMAMGGHAAIAPIDGANSAAASRLEAANVALLALRKQKGVARGTSADVALGQHPAIRDTTAPQSTKSSSHNGHLSALRAGLITSLSEIPSSSSNQITEVTVYPDLLLGMLREELAVIGRIWLLCRLLDREGRGWLTVATVREELTRKGAPLRVCGWRRLRQVLADGAEKFWERDDAGRLWLFGRKRVATHLGITRFQHNPVRLTGRQLTASIGDVKAHFYATLHSSRALNGSDNPISRKTLSKLAGVCDRTQQRYDERVGIEKRQAIGVGGAFTTESNQQQIWNGRSTFKLVDRLGRYGKAGASYVAWHLPNQYGAIHGSAPSNNRRRLNRELAACSSTENSSQDLANQRAQGNGVNRLFLRDGRAASVQRRANCYLKTNDVIWIAIG